eukprot:3946499-Pleurochrysis_carterae.AAC.2
MREVLGSPGQTLASIRLTSCASPGSSIEASCTWQHAQSAAHVSAMPPFCMRRSIYSNFRKNGM